METITSRENAKIKYACAVRDSEAARGRRAFLCRGAEAVPGTGQAAARRARGVLPRRRLLAKTPELAELRPLPMIAPHVAEKLSGHQDPIRACLLCLKRPCRPLDTLDTARRILMLEGVQDPGNVGTLLRSAAAFGFDAVVLGPGCAVAVVAQDAAVLDGRGGAAADAARATICPPRWPRLRARGVTTLATALYRSRPAGRGRATISRAGCALSSAARGRA